MKLKIFSVYDSKVAAYMQPFFMRSKGEAIRAFIGAIEDPKTQFNAHPEDFTLFEIGEYDDETAGMVGCCPISLGTALEYKSKKVSEEIPNTENFSIG